MFAVLSALWVNETVGMCVIHSEGMQKSAHSKNANEVLSKFCISIFSQQTSTNPYHDPTRTPPDCSLILFSSSIHNFIQCYNQ